MRLFRLHICMHLRLRLYERDKKPIKRHKIPRHKAHSKTILPLAWPEDVFCAGKHSANSFSVNANAPTGLVTAIHQ